MAERFDVVVVGAGPGGSTAAYLLAKAGLDVALVERGPYPGAKNIFGGVLYSQTLNKLIPDFWAEAPVERAITRRSITFMTPESSFSLDFGHTEYGRAPYNGFTVFRPRFDQWLADRAQAAGALLIPETTATDLIWQGERVAGVITDRADGELRADLVVAADGVNSLLARKAGLAQPLLPGDVALGIKQVLALDAGVINNRFNVASGEGVAREFVGCTEGLPGGAFLYTNRSSLAVGIVVQVEALQGSRVRIYDLLEQFKGHPHVRGLVNGAKLMEYAAHLIPERGYRMVPRYGGKGMLLVGDAAGFVLSTGVNLEGVNYAVASGMAAAQAVLRAKAEGQMTEGSAAYYQEALAKSFVLRNLKRFRHTPVFLRNTKLYSQYPQLLSRVLQGIYSVPNGERGKVAGVIRRELGTLPSTISFLADCLRGVRSL